MQWLLSSVSFTQERIFFFSTAGALWSRIPATHAGTGSVHARIVLRRGRRRHVRGSCKGRSGGRLRVQPSVIAPAAVRDSRICAPKPLVCLSSSLTSHNWRQPRRRRHKPQKATHASTAVARALFAFLPFFLMSGVPDPWSRAFEVLPTRYSSFVFLRILRSRVYVACMMRGAVSRRLNRRCRFAAAERALGIAAAGKGTE